MIMQKKTNSNLKILPNIMVNREGKPTFKMSVFSWQKVLNFNENPSLYIKSREDFRKSGRIWGGF